jgi:hypothetical protein
MFELQKSTKMPDPILVLSQKKLIKYCRLGHFLFPFKELTFISHAPKQLQVCLLLVILALLIILYGLVEPCQAVTAALVKPWWR